MNTTTHPKVQTVIDLLAKHGWADITVNQPYTNFYTVQAQSDPTGNVFTNTRISVYVSTRNRGRLAGLMVMPFGRTINPRRTTWSNLRATVCTYGNVKHWASENR